jgi:hypothetical protein
LALRFLFQVFLHYLLRWRIQGEYCSTIPHSRPGFKRRRLLSLIDVFAACAQPEELEDAFVPGLDLAVIKLAMQLHGGALRHCCISQQATLSPWAASSASIKELPSARLQMSRSGSLLS